MMMILNELLVKRQQQKLILNDFYLKSHNMHCKLYGCLLKLWISCSSHFLHQTGAPSDSVMQCYHEKIARYVQKSTNKILIYSVC